MRYVYNDGGRSAAYKAKTDRDCVCRVIAIATEQPYKEVYLALKRLAREERTGPTKWGRSTVRTGTYKETFRRYLESIGWTWVPTMFVGKGCQVHLRAGELPRGRLVVSVSKHLTAVIDGVIYDTFDCSRDGTRCVYGYFVKR